MVDSVVGLEGVDLLVSMEVVVEGVTLEGVEGEEEEEEEATSGTMALKSKKLLKMKVMVQ